MSANFPLPSTRFRLVSSSFEGYVIEFPFTKDSSVGELMTHVFALQSMLHLYSIVAPKNYRGFEVIYFVVDTTKAV